jgi:DNA-binding CsgD family transcriptional regulator
VHPFIECAVRRVYERAEGEAMRDSVHMALDDHARGLAFLDWQLRLVHANRVARCLCNDWHAAAASPAEWLLPEPIARACYQLRSEWREALHANADAIDVVLRRTVMHPAIAGLDAVVSMVPAGQSGIGDPSFVIAFQQRSVLNGLTAAERAAAIVVGEGVSNQEIADRLGKSVAAVKFLLHRVYRKTGVANRAALVSMLRTSPLAGDKPS